MREGSGIRTGIRRCQLHCCSALPGLSGSCLCAWSPRHGRRLNTKRGPPKSPNHLPVTPSPPAPPWGFRGGVGQRGETPSQVGMPSRRPHPLPSPPCPRNCLRHLQFLTRLFRAHTQKGRPAAKTSAQRGGFRAPPEKAKAGADSRGAEARAWARSPAKSSNVADKRGRRRARGRPWSHATGERQFVWRKNPGKF